MLRPVVSTLSLSFSPQELFLLTVPPLSGPGRKCFARLVWLALAATACSDGGPAQLVGSGIRAELEEIYLSSEPSRFDSFLDAWSSTYVPATTAERAQLSDTVQAVYQIFETFWNPTSLNLYAGAGWLPSLGDKAYEGAEYAIVPSTIKYWMHQAPVEEIVEVPDFRPRILISGLQPLPLTREHLGGIALFLEAGPSAPDRLNRRSFLNNRLKSIMPGFRHGWHFLMFPEVRFITFVDGLDRAFVHFRIGLEGGTADFERNNDGTWVMLQSNMVWFEGFPPG